MVGKPAAPTLIPRERLPLSAPYVAPKNSIEQSLTELWQQALQVAPIGVHDDYYELGGNSLRGIEIFLEIERTYGVRLPLSLPVDQPTIAHLAVSIADAGGAPPECLVPIQPAGTRTPLFCIHDISGNVIVFRRLAEHLGPEQPVFGLQYPGQNETPMPYHSVEEMAARYLAEVRRAQAIGPYFLCGYSIGGVIAYEMARQLRASGQEVALLANFDGGAPGYPAQGLFKVLDHALEFTRRPPWTWPAYFRQRLNYRLARNGGLSAIYHTHVLDDTSGGSARAIETIARKIIPKAQASYVPRPYPGAMQLFRCAEDRAFWRRIPELGWRGLVTGSIEIHDIPATHQELLNEPAVTAVARHLRECLVREHGCRILGEPPEPRGERRTG